MSVPDVCVTPESAGWTYTGLRVITLEAGQKRSWNTGHEEQLVLPLEGSCSVRAGGQTFQLVGRRDVFAGPSDSLYLPIETDVELSSEAGGVFAIPSSRATQRLAIEYLPVTSVPVEVRGAGSATRQLNNFFAPGQGHAQRLVAVEVITPEGNTSSYPPHKHDQVTAAGEAELEEIYYFRFRTPHAMGMHATYTADGSFEVTARVRTGDVYLVPKGYHGPCVALPGYDMYYLNVLAGPGAQRSLGFTDDPAHAWIRGSWKDMAIDPRAAHLADAARAARAP